MAPENLVDTTRLLDVARRYPTLEVSALAERFGASDTTIRNVLKAAGLSRDEEISTPVRGPDHPWRPTTRRRPAAIAMTKIEREKLIADFLAKNAVTRVAAGTTTADVVFLDTFND
jgi:DeoR/GlpR family transcriptional regulator of sugar metabolism